MNTKSFRYLSDERVFQDVQKLDYRLTRSAFETCKRRDWRDFKEYLEFSADDQYWNFIASVCEEVKQIMGIPTAEDDLFIYLRRAIAEVELLKLPSLSLNDRKLLPNSTGVYLIKSMRGEVLYVGSSSKSLRERVCNKNHEAIGELKEEVKAKCTIEWYLYSHSNLCRLETYLIRKYEPILNTHSIPGLKPRSSKLSDDEIRSLCKELSYTEVAKIAGIAPAYARVICQRDLDIFPFTFDLVS